MLDSLRSLYVDHRGLLKSVQLLALVLILKRFTRLNGEGVRRVIGWVLNTEICRVWEEDFGFPWASI